MMWITAMLMGCRPAITFNVTRPAEIAVEQNIQRLAVINRFGSDSATATSAAFVSELLALANPRFSAVSRQAANNAMASVNATEGAPLGPTQVTSLCESLGVSGIVSLEEMDTTDTWSFSERINEETTTVTVNGRSREETREVTIHEAFYNVDIATTWRLYTCESGRSRDFYQTVVSSSWTGEGSSRGDARTDVGNTDNLTEDLAITAAWVYLKRISPYDVSITRKYYRGFGNNELRLGGLYLTAERYEDAQKTLRSGAKGADGKRKGKMLYNLALASEQLGDLEAALKQSRRANNLLNNNLSNELVRRLRARVQQEAEIKEQLDEAPAAEDTEETEGPQLPAQSPMNRDGSEEE
jgi:hypothetical protein